MVAFSPLVVSNYSQSVSFSGGDGTNTTVSGSATNAPVPTPILQVNPGSIGYGTILVGASKRTVLRSEYWDRDIKWHRYRGLAI